MPGSSEIRPSPARRVAVVIVAAGRGMRAGPPFDEAKQFRRLGDRPMLAHTLACFRMPEINGPLVAVIRPEDADRTGACFADAGAECRLALGGQTRQQSVYAGLEALAPDAPDIVLIHDAARPFADRATILRVIAAVDAETAALPMIAIADTLKRVDSEGFIAGTVDRRGLFGAQTPQGFHYATIRDAHARAASEGVVDFTDDAAIMEWAGGRVRSVEGSPENIKLTYAADFIRAETRLGRRHVTDIRTGNGYDVHQLVPGEHVTLCGVRIPHDQSLSGHSDADVGLHALTDALLATCGAGDIGVHFPPSDERWRGAASHVFVRHAVRIVAENGGRICNADVTLIAEAPKVLPHREAMRAAMADMLDIDLVRVSVKATTNETIGFVGRREGIAAIATASVSYGEKP